jgi:hypothetical protein
MKDRTDAVEVNADAGPAPLTEISAAEAPDATSRAAAKAVTFLRPCKSVFFMANSSD